jgi:hypothetical protein
MEINMQQPFGNIYHKACSGKKTPCEALFWRNPYRVLLCPRVGTFGGYAVVKRIVSSLSWKPLTLLPPFWGAFPSTGTSALQNIPTDAFLWAQPLAGCLPIRVRCREGTRIIPAKETPDLIIP